MTDKKSTRRKKNLAAYTSVYSGASYKLYEVLDALDGVIECRATFSCAVRDNFDVISNRVEDSIVDLITHFVSSWCWNNLD